MTIDERAALLREFGEILVDPELTVRDVALIASALKFATKAPGIVSCEVALSRLVGIISKLRVALNFVDESLDPLFMGEIYLDEEPRAPAPEGAH
jgi:hypothetical protein